MLQGEPYYCRLTAAARYGQEGIIIIESGVVSIRVYLLNQLFLYFHDRSSFNSKDSDT